VGDTRTIVVNSSADEADTSALEIATSDSQGDTSALVSHTKATFGYTGAILGDTRDTEVYTGAIVVNLVATIGRSHSRLYSWEYRWVTLGALKVTLGSF
jgi:hypothetical protein